MYECTKKTIRKKTIRSAKIATVAKSYRIASNWSLWVSSSSSLNAKSNHLSNLDKSQGLRFFQLCLQNIHTHANTGQYWKRSTLCRYELWLLKNIKWLRVSLSRIAFLVYQLFLGSSSYFNLCNISTWVLCKHSSMSWKKSIYSKTWNRHFRRKSFKK